MNRYIHSKDLGFNSKIGDIATLYEQEMPFKDGKVLVATMIAYRPLGNDKPYIVIPGYIKDKETDQYDNQVSIVEPLSPEDRKELSSLLKSRPDFKDKPVNFW